MKRFLEFGTPERTKFIKKLTPGEMPNEKFQEADHIKKMDFDERMMTDRQKLVQIQHYWDDLDHIASDDTKKKSLQRLGYKNIKLNSRGKITSFDEEVKIDELYKDYPGKGWVLGTKDEPKKLKDKDIVWRSKVHHWDNDVRSNNTRLIIVKNKGKFDMWAKSDKSGKIVFHFGTKPTLDAAKEFASIRKWQQKEEVEEERDYKDEYKKFQSTKKAIKYRSELNQYNRKRGTYGNNDGKDASHKNGKIVGFEDESTNRGRREKSRLKVNETFKSFEEYFHESRLDDKLDKLVSNEIKKRKLAKFPVNATDDIKMRMKPNKPVFKFPSPNSDMMIHVYLRKMTPPSKKGMMAFNYQLEDK